MRVILPILFGSAVRSSRVSLELKTPMVDRITQLCTDIVAQDLGSMSSAETPTTGSIQGLGEVFEIAKSRMSVREMNLFSTALTKMWGVNRFSVPETAVDVAVELLLVMHADWFEPFASTNACIVPAARIAKRVGMSEQESVFGTTRMF